MCRNHLNNNNNKQGLNRFPKYIRNIYLFTKEHYIEQDIDRLGWDEMVELIQSVESLPDEKKDIEHSLERLHQRGWYYKVQEDQLRVTELSISETTSKQENRDHT